MWYHTLSGMPVSHTWRFKGGTWAEVRILSAPKHWLACGLLLCACAVKSVQCFCFLVTLVHFGVCTLFFVSTALSWANFPMLFNRCRCLSLAKKKKKKEYLSMNLTKEVNDLYNEKYRILRNKLKNILESRKTSHVHGLAELVLLKWPYYQRWSIASM